MDMNDRISDPLFDTNFNIDVFHEWIGLIHLNSWIQNLNRGMGRNENVYFSQSFILGYFVVIQI